MVSEYLIFWIKLTKEEHNGENTEPTKTTRSDFVPSEVNESEK